MRYTLKDCILFQYDESRNTLRGIYENEDYRVNFIKRLSLFAYRKYNYFYNIGEIFGRNRYRKMLSVKGGCEFHTLKNCDFSVMGEYEKLSDFYKGD